METIKYEGLTIKIEQDTRDGEGPRDWDNAGTMVCFHSRYNLGDKHGFGRDVDAAKEYLATVVKNGGLVLPLYLYDHSGITMNTTGFSCPWDSGQVGWIYITYDTIIKEWGGKKGRNVTQAMREKATACLISEVKVYDQYLTGEVYGYTITDAEGKHEDSCWGFYGHEYCVEEATNAAKSLWKRMHPLLSVAGVDVHYPKGNYHEIICTHNGRRRTVSLHESGSGHNGG